MIDFRFRVTDTEKARYVLDRKIKPYLQDPLSGATVASPTPPKIGSLRQSKLEPVVGRVYFMIFANPGRYLKRGSKVNIVIGEFRAEGIAIE